MADIANGIRWAAGISVPGLPSNPNKADVINMSIGSTVVTTCSATYQSAINDARAAGVVVVVATGNEDNRLISSPANCVGTIAVTAHGLEGEVASYANVGTGTTISAPGGAWACKGTVSCGANYVASTFNSGERVYLQDSYNNNAGTSMAAPHVAGVAALLLSKNPTLTPDQVKALIADSARPFAAGYWCTYQPLVNGANICGSGMLDAKAALDLLALRHAVPTPPPAPTPPPPSSSGGGSMGLTFLLFLLLLALLIAAFGRRKL
jgi:serine protease